MVSPFQDRVKEIAASFSERVQLSTETKFYVYVLTDSSMPGSWDYDVVGKNVTFKHQPFYVGKGQQHRVSQHVRQALSGHGKTAKAHKIRKICTSGHEVVEVVSKILYTEAEALAIELLLIEAIGRRDLKRGPLTNLSDGGEGPSGAKRSAKQIARLKAALFKWRSSLTAEQSSSIAHQNYAAMSDSVRENRRLKISASSLKYHSELSDAQKQRRSASLRAAHARQTEDQRRARSEKLKRAHVFMSDDTKRLRSEKYRESMTVDKQLARAEKIRLQYANRTPEEKAARAAKISATKQARKAQGKVI